MRTRVREQRVMISLTRLEAETLEVILADFGDLTEYAGNPGDRAPRNLARRLRNSIVDRVRDVHEAQKSLSIARGNDRRRSTP